MKTILIVEDNPDNLDLVLQFLEDENYKVISANSAEDGLVCFRDMHIDLILMDISLPVMDGLEATRIIREEKGQVPIIALTARAMTSDRIESIEAGCNEYISKPVDREHLIDTIKALI